MERADVGSGTLGRATASLGTCSGVLEIYQSEPIIEILWARGTQLQTGFNDLAQVLDVPAVCDGFAVKPRIKFIPECIDYQRSDDGEIKVVDSERSAEEAVLAMSIFLQETALRGVLWHPAGGNISAAMTQEDIETALTAMGDSLIVVKRALDSGDWSILKGQPIQNTPFVRKA